MESAISLGTLSEQYAGVVRARSVDNNRCRYVDEGGGGSVC